MKKMMATMILAAMVTLSTPQAFAGHMLGDAARTGNERNSILLGDHTSILLGDFASILLGDLTSILLGD